MILSNNFYLCFTFFP